MWELGAYHRLNQGLNANAMFINDLEDNLNKPGGADQCDLAKNKYFDLPDSWALAGSMDKELASLQEAPEGLDGMMNCMELSKNSDSRDPKSTILYLSITWLSKRKISWSLLLPMIWW